MMNLGGIDEVPELCLPEDQPVGAVQAVPVFEAEHPGFGKRAVVNLHRRLIRRDLLKRHEPPPILSLAQGRMPLAEGFARRVLTR